MDLLNSFVSLIGIILGFAGVGLTFVTFFSPGFIQGLALKDAKRWMPVPSVVEGNKAYRHKIFSGFTIEVRLSEPICVDTYFEWWMEALHRPDKSATSYYVFIFFNGLPMDRLLFLEYDGGRNFIPVPMLNQADHKSYVSFSPKQKQVAEIVGFDYFDRKFDDVEAAITKSRYNPFFVEFSTNGMDERLEALQAKIDSFKSRRSIK